MYGQESLRNDALSNRGQHNSHGVLECEPDLKNLRIELLDLPSEVEQLLVFLLSASRVLLLAVVGQLVDLQRVVKVFRVLSLFFEALDGAGADSETVRGHTSLRCLCGCLHLITTRSSN